MSSSSSKMFSHSKNNKNLECAKILHAAYNHLKQQAEALKMLEAKEEKKSFSLKAMINSNTATLKHIRDAYTATELTSLHTHLYSAYSELNCIDNHSDIISEDDIGHEINKVNKKVIEWIAKVRDSIELPLVTFPHPSPYIPIASMQQIYEAEKKPSEPSFSTPRK